MLLIDRKEMIVAFKHRDKAACEAERKHGKVYVNVDETDPVGFRGLTQLEMKLLYRNLGQVAGTVITNADSVRSAIVKLLKYKLDNIPSNSEMLPLFVPNPEKPVVDQPAPKGQTSNLIWDVADEIWIGAGRPTDQKLVLTLRKKIMQDLETLHGVKKNTASNELGKWQKARI